MEQQKVVLSRIAKRIDIFQTCQEIKSLTHRLLGLTIPARANHSCGDEEIYSIEDISTRLCSHFDMLSDELTILYALEQLDVLKGSRSNAQSPQNYWIGILVPFQSLSSISFRLFRQFQVYDSLTITAILILLIDNDNNIQVRYIMSFMRYIIAQMASGNGRSHLEEGFTTLPAKDTKIVYDWVSADTAIGKVLGCRKLESNCTLYDIWKAIEPLMLRRLDCLGKLDLNSLEHNIESNPNQKVETYADHLFNFSHIKCICDDMIAYYPLPWEFFNRVVRTDSCKIVEIFGYTQGLLYTCIDTTNTCRVIKHLRITDGVPLCNENVSFIAAPSTYLESLANLTQSPAGVEAVTQSILDFDLIPYLIKETSSEEKKIGYHATIILQKLFERPSTFYWFLDNDCASQIQSMVFRNQAIMKYIKSVLTCQSLGLVNELRRSWKRFLYLSVPPTANENLIDLKQLIVYLQIYLWELCLNDHRQVYFMIIANFGACAFE